jgi:tetratricopeptide (TPR) repeat protein
MLKSAMASHDRGDYDNAILRYNQILEENPHDATALYELSYTYLTKKDYRAAYETSLRAAQYKSPILPTVYVNVGTALDLMGESKKAIKVYREAIKRFPQVPMLYYNLAVTHLGREERGEAKAALKNSVSLNPSHGSSHLALAKIYLNDQEKIPALLAASAFLLIEPATPRTQQGLQILQLLLDSSVAKTGEDQYTISLGGFDDSEEGEFLGAEMALGAAVAAAVTQDEVKSGPALLSAAVGTTFSVLGFSPDEPARGFAAEYYAPFFAEMDERDLTEPFVYHILESTGSPEVTAWLAENPARVEALLAWVSEYQWPRIGFRD